MTSNSRLNALAMKDGLPMNDRVMESVSIKLQDEASFGFDYRLPGSKLRPRYEWRAIAALGFRGVEQPIFICMETDVDSRDDADRQLWSGRMLAETVESARRGLLSAFASNTLRSYSDHAAAVEPVAVSAPTEQVERLRSEHDEIELASRKFDFAVERLRQFADSPPRAGYSSDALDMYRFLSDCLAAAYLSTMHSWYSEKLGRIRRAIDELTTRTNRHHYGFQRAQEDIREPLCMFQPPKAWVDVPPRYPLVGFDPQ